LAAEDARMKAGLKTAEDELNLIKNQVQQTLLDIREHILDATNPFNAIDDALTDEDEIEFGDDLMGGGAGAAGAAGADGGTDGEADGSDSEDLDDIDNLPDEDDDDEGEELYEEDADGGEGDIVEEYPDDGYGDEIIDDGMGGGGGMSSGAGGVSEEIFEEEVDVPDEDEGFELDEEPSDDEMESDEESDAQASADGAATGANRATAPLMADFDVLTMAGLVRWVAVTTERLGPNRTEILLDAFESAGRIAPATRMVLHHLMALSEEDPSENVPVREIVSAMVRMEGVLDTNTGSESSRLLSMLMDVDDDPLDRMMA
jgi:hypothetical protein